MNQPNIGRGISAGTNLGDKNINVGKTGIGNNGNTLNTIYLDS